MATTFTQDTVLHYLRSSGGSVKNSDLLLHFRNFIRDHSDQVRNRELFKKFVNSVATVQQLDGVSYVVLRRKFKGYVPAGGEEGSPGPLRLPAGRNTEPSTGSTTLSPAGGAETPRLREETAPAPPGGTAGKTALPAAGIILNNNNNNVETNLNLKQEQVNSTREVSGRPEAAQVSQISKRRDVKPPSLSEAPVQDRRIRVGQQTVGFGPFPGITPVGPAVRHHGQPQQVRVRVPEPLRGREASPQPKAGLHQQPPFNQEPPLHHSLYQGPPLHHSLHQEPPLHYMIRHQEPPLHHHVNLHQGPPLHHVNLHQEPPLHHVNLHQGPPLHHSLQQEPPHHHVKRHKEPPLHQEPPLQHNLHQEPPLHHHVNLHQESPLHHSLQQEPPLHHVKRHKEPPLHQEPPLHHVNFHKEPPLHQQPPLQHNLHQEPPLHHVNFHKEPPLHQEPPLQQVNLQPEMGPRRFRHRQSYKSAVSYDEDEEEEDDPVRQGSAGGAWPLSAPLGDMGKAMSASLPCIIDTPAPPSVASSSSSSSSEKKLPKIYIQDVKGEMLPIGGPGCGLKSGVGHRGQWAAPVLQPVSVPVESMSTRRSLPLEAERRIPSPDRAQEVAPHREVHTDRRYSQPAAVQLETGQRPDQNQRVRLSSSHSSIFSPSSDTGISNSDWPPSASSRGSEWNSSCEDLHARTGKAGSGSQIQEVLQRAQRTKLESETHHANYKTTAHPTGFHRSMGNLHDDQESSGHLTFFHHSTGDLYDDSEEAESSEGSTFTPVRQPLTVARQLSSQLRSRMCRSLGADLDQLLQEEAGGGGGGGSEAARLNRLHLISSSLSLRYNLSSSSLSSCSTPPRCHSLADLVEREREGKGGRRSLPTGSSSAAHHEGPNRQSLVPLDPKEHAWLVKGAAGAWPDIYSLFREDSSLLNRRDFISGFTVLHWIAKHGDHRVLNTLWYGVEKAGMTFDINARSASGHTPLHIAAIHGHKNIMRLLVGKFNADVKLRDTAGKKPWQYLNRTTSSDVFQLLEAPARAVLRGEGTVEKDDSSLRPEQPRRRRRHHFSTASGQRPVTVAGMVKVKRSSSIAALLKHKSMRRFYGHQSDSSV